MAPPSGGIRRARWSEIGIVVLTLLAAGAAAAESQEDLRWNNAMFAHGPPIALSAGPPSKHPTAKKAEDLAREVASVMHVVPASESTRLAHMDAHEESIHASREARVELENQEEEATRTGTIRYMAPEAMQTRARVGGGHEPEENADERLGIGLSADKRHEHETSSKTTGLLWYGDPKHWPHIPWTGNHSQKYSMVAIHSNYTTRSLTF